ncbi:MAG: CBS domain-containing protein [Sandaracinaceae bacterium]
MFQTPVRDAMTSPVVSCAPELSVELATRDLSEHDISSLAVVQAGQLVGLVSRADVLPFAIPMGAHPLPERPLAEHAVESIMTRPVVSVRPETSLAGAAAVMVERRIHRVIVAEEGRPLGVVSTRDLMDAVANAPCDVAISELATVPVHCVDVAASIAEAIAQLEELRVTALIVCEHEQPMGVLSQRGALLAARHAGGSRVEEAMDAAVICLHETASVHRAARLARRMGARRIVTTRHRSLHGVLSGMDFARFVATAANR